MSRFPIAISLADALKVAVKAELDAIGQRFYTFRVSVTEDDSLGHGLVSELVDNGWQLRGGPLLIEASDNTPHHLLVSMCQTEPRTLRIDGRLELGGKLRAEGRLTGEAHRK